jgi:hypothetical protein
MMEALSKLDVLKDTITDTAQMDLVLGKLLEITFSDYRHRLERYERDLGEFEQRYSMKSPVFYQRFEAGELGDAMDFFDWAGLYKLRQDAQEKVRRLESAL